MKSHIIRVSTAGMSRAEWLSYRQTGIGSTESGIILGLSEYTSSLELYYRKIGLVPLRDVQNVPMFMGHQLEALTAKLWTYWEGSQASVLANYDRQRPVRHCHAVRAYLRHPKYPWLFTSLDRVIPPQLGKPRGNLELKQISRNEAAKWQGGVPPSQVAQVNHQMLVAELAFTELAQLQDGRWFDVLPIEPSRVIMDAVVEQTHAFWLRVEAGRRLVNERYEHERRFDQRGVDDLNAQIDALAPEPDGTLAYTEYLSERYRQPTSAALQGTPEDLAQARLHLTAAANARTAQEAARQAENVLKLRMKTAQVLDFGAAGRVYWTETADGKRVFRNSVKVTA